MKKQVEKNYIYNLIYQFIVILTPLILTPYTARILEVDGVGLNSGINSICSTFLLFAVLGTSTYAVKYIGSVQENIKTRSVRFWEIQIFRTLTTSLTFIGYIFFINHTESNWIQYYLIYSILLVNVIADITWFFQGLEEFRIIVIRNVLVRIAFIVLVFILVKTKNDLALYMMLSCITTLLGSLLMWASLPKFIEMPQWGQTLLNSLRYRMNQSKGLAYVATSNTSYSKWCPWELGYFDGNKNGRCCILPVLDSNDSRYEGQEYLGLYPYLDYEKVQGSNSYTFWVNNPTNQGQYISLEDWLNGETY